MFNKPHPDTDNLKRIMIAISNRIHSLELDLKWYIQHVRISNTVTSIYISVKASKDKTERHLDQMRNLKKDAEILKKDILKMKKEKRDIYDIMQLSKNSYMIIYQKYAAITNEILRQ